ncbi:MAG TPA: autotransporter assembly complex family protein [Hyphomonadaceae bacterium]|nr:autotransporter assembly complex family protein [Hyphomonadaceae bacterium]
MAFGRPDIGPPRMRLFGKTLAGLVIALACLASPLAPAAFAQAGRVPVDGIPPALSDDLKRLQREEPEPTTLFEAQRQAQRAVDVVKAFLESEGYYQAEVEYSADGENTFKRQVHVVAGPLFTYASRKIEYSGAEPDALTTKEIDTLLAPLEAGVPARAQPVIETGDAIIKRLKAAGYPDAKQEPVDVLADGRQHTIELTFKVQPGLRASFGKINISGLDRTREQFVLDLKPWKDNERYQTEKLDEFRARLAETGLFDTAAVRLDDAGQPLDNGLSSRDVDVEVKERKRRTITAGASVSTSDGYGVDGSWELRNFTGWGDSVKVSAQVATLQSILDTSYVRPNIGRYGRNLKLDAKVEDLETDAFDQTGGSVSATLQEQLTPRMRGSLGLEAGYASILDAQAKLLGTGRRDVYTLSSTATAEYVGVRDILDPVNGVRARLAIEPGITFGDTNIGFAKITGEASIYADLGSDKLVGALRGKIGTIAGANGAPPDRLFFAGGGGSVRGYDYQSLSPRDADGVLIGGRSLVEVSGELRYRASNSLGYVAFLDAGAAGSNVEPPIDAMRLGVGFGVRYYAGFGPLRADIAFPLNKEPGDADFQIYISIGQAF